MKTTKAADTATELAEDYQSLLQLSSIIPVTSSISVATNNNSIVLGWLHRNIDRINSVRIRLIILLTG